MEGKPAVTILQEYCARYKIEHPKYDYISGEDGGFVCKAELLNMEAYGNGRSKRDAKHHSALNILRKIQSISGVNFNSINISDTVDDELTNLNQDMVKELRDYCVRHDIPLPTIEIVQRSGTPNAPEFMACCTIATITRYGKSDKKKDARQRAATEMLSVISKGMKIAESSNMQMVTEESLDITTVDDIEAERRRKFKTYHELIDANIQEDLSIKLCDRHNYFKNYFPHLKEEALVAINSTNYETACDKVEAVLNALKLKPRITKLKSYNMEPLMQIELDCEYDFVMISPESQMYNKLLDYFSDMLV